MPVSKCKNSKIVSEAATDILLFCPRAARIVEAGGALTFRTAVIAAAACVIVCYCACYKRMLRLQLCLA